MLTLAYRCNIGTTQIGGVSPTFRLFHPSLLGGKVHTRSDRKSSGKTVDEEKMGNVTSFIARCWDEVGGNRANYIDEWQKLAGDSLPLEPTKQVMAWIEIYDQFLSWLISYNIIYQYCCLQGFCLASLDKCRMSIGAAVISYAISLRKLAIDGHEVPARHIMRSLREYVDVLALLTIKPELSDNFILTQDEKSANDFWWKHIAKKKIGDEIRRHRNNMLGKAVYTPIDEWKKSENFSLQMVSHPSYMAGAATILFGLRSSDVDELWNPLGILGARTNNCVRTIRYGVFTLHEHLLECPVSAFSGYAFEDQSIKILHEHVVAGVGILDDLMMYVVENQNGDELGVS